mmetsp:Transcript_51860/g.150923  ORF Transcript_51860/g.150923 Transcript_51860/m.150923 type:complete len:206 (+) Transcript_51860:192-809(+)
MSKQSCFNHPPVTSSEFLLLPLFLRTLHFAGTFLPPSSASRSFPCCFPFVDKGGVTVSNPSAYLTPCLPEGSMSLSAPRARYVKIDNTAPKESATLAISQSRPRPSAWISGMCAVMAAKMAMTPNPKPRPVNKSIHQACLHQKMPAATRDMEIEAHTDNRASQIAVHPMEPESLDVHTSTSNGGGMVRGILLQSKSRRPVVNAWK